MTHTTLREQAADALRKGLPHQLVPMGEPVSMPWNPEFPKAQYMAQETEQQRAERLADVVVGVVLGAVRAELDALPYWQSGLCGQQVETYRERVLAVLARLGGDQ